MCMCADAHVQWYDAGRDDVKSYDVVMLCDAM